jgi:hypothetical protein
MGLMDMASRYLHIHQMEVTRCKLKRYNVTAVSVQCSIADSTIYTLTEIAAYFNPYTYEMKEYILRVSHKCI